jgi:hypothetical protein
MKSVAKTEKLFLDDLAVGDEFTSEEYTVDAPWVQAVRLRGLGHQAGRRASRGKHRRQHLPLKSKPDRGIVTVQTDTLNQWGEPCQRSVAKILAFRRG